jgi:hypothetical protein
VVVNIKQRWPGLLFTAQDLRAERREYVIARIKRELGLPPKAPDTACLSAIRRLAVQRLRTEARVDGELQD